MPKKHNKKPNILYQILVEFFPDKSDEFRSDVLWNCTTFPFDDIYSEEGIEKYKQFLQQVKNDLSNGIDPFERSANELDKTMDKLREKQDCPGRYKKLAEHIK